MREHRTTYRVGDITKKTVKSVSADNSAKRYTENSLRAHLGWVAHATKGHDDIRDMVQYLNAIEGITEEPPEVTIKIGLLPETPRRRITVEFGESLLSRLDDVQDGGLNQSDVFRICIFRQLYQQILSSETSLRDSEEKAIVRHWTGMKSELLAVNSKFYEILFRRFVRLYPQTQKLLEYDVNRFKRFAELYKEEFYGSETYEEIANQHSRSVFVDVENSIEEFTGITFPDEIKNTK